jgi:hypothetical protein
MDIFFRLINQFLESRKNASEPQLDFEFEEMDGLDNLIVTVHTEDDYNFTMSIFDHDQWTMVTDICDLTNQSPEEVVRSLDASAPNILKFTRDDLDPSS